MSHCSSIITQYTTFVKSLSVIHAEGRDGLMPSFCLAQREAFWLSPKFPHSPTLVLLFRFPILVRRANPREFGFCERPYPRQTKGRLDAVLLFGAERGIRTPGQFPVNGFQDRRNRPLYHLCILFISRIHNPMRISTILLYPHSKKKSNTFPSPFENVFFFLLSPFKTNSFFQKKVL